MEIGGVLGVMKDSVAVKWFCLLAQSELIDVTLLLMRT